MLHYMLQTIGFQLLFLMVYDLFLKRETFFNANRLYLLSTMLLSLFLPFIKVTKFKEIVPKEYVIRLPEVFIGTPIEDNSLMHGTLLFSEQAPTSWSWSWDYLLYAGMFLTFMFFLFKLAKLAYLIQYNSKRWKGDVLVVSLKNSNAAFSFFNYVFLGENISSKDFKVILSHEAVHVKQKHSLDLLFFELLRIAFWFNPLVYLYQSRIAELHEYIADANATKSSDKNAYYENLLAQLFNTQNLSIINTFFKQSLIKKRIAMLRKSKSKHVHLLKYLLLAPLVFTMLLYTSSYAQETKRDDQEINYQELSDEELEELYYNQLNDSADTIFGNSMDLFDEYMPNRDKYIMSRNEFYKTKAFLIFLLEKNNSKKGSEVWDKMRPNKKYDNYQEYLEYKKTMEAKINWEANIKNGVLRLVVEDFGNFTEEEQRRYDKKLKMIETDNYFNKLMITDGKAVSTMEFHSINEKEIPKPNGESEKDLPVENISETIEIPFNVIEESPTFSFCEHLKTNDERKKCMIENVTKHVNNNFNTDLAKTLGLTGRQRINVLFKIDKEGYVKGVKARAPHPKLEEEAKRVINALPQFIPGIQKGRTVVVPYSLPIVFQVSEGNQELKKNSNQEDKAIPFSELDEKPVLMTCEHTADRKFRESCTVDGISSFVAKNFNMKIAKSSNLEGVQRIVVLFIINKKGNITEVKVTAPNADLEEEAKRVINKLGKFMPGKHKGELVDVMYSLPIQFKIAP